MKKGLIKAVIDCGSNTFHLLIVSFASQSEYSILHKEKVAVKIGVGGIQNNTITDAGAQRAISTLTLFSKKMAQYNVQQYTATATSAFRNAKNGIELTKEIKEKTGIKVTILDGIEEAKLIHKGVTKAVKLKKNHALIMDIGGGSVEFILCNELGIKWMKSFEIGGIRLRNHFHKTDIISSTDIKNLNEYLKRELKELYDSCRNHPPSNLIGASGSFDTLSAIYAAENKIRFDEDENLSFDLPIESTVNTINKLVSLSRKERKEVKGMVPLRVDLIVVAGLLIKNIVEEIPFKKIITTGHALKEGLL